MYYVTMTDKHLSGWGMAAGKINKVILECESYEQAEIVEDNARHQGSMKHINISSKKPYYNSDRYYAQTKTKEECPRWYEQGYFKNYNETKI